MRLVSLTTTSDGRLFMGQAYEGQIVVISNDRHRFLCFDAKKEWMTFALDAFIPSEESMRRWCAEYNERTQQRWAQQKTEEDRAPGT